MTSSGNTTYTLTTNQIISQALLDLGVVGPGEAVQSEDYNTCLDSLNCMIREWQTPTYGLHRWLETECTLYINPGQAYYQIGGTTSDKVSQSDNSHITTLTTTAIGGATSLVVTSTAGMSVNDNIGIVQDDGTTFWTTIATITPTTGLTINSGLLSQASAGNNVYTYTTLAGKMMDINNVRCRRSGGTTTILMTPPLSKQQYFEIPNLTIQSSPIQYMVDRKIDHSRIYLYGTGNTGNDCIVFTGIREIQDFTLAANNPDLPKEWLRAIRKNLSVEVSPMYGKEFKASSRLIQQATDSLEALRSYDQEDAPLFFHPDMSHYD